MLLALPINPKLGFIYLFICFEETVLILFFWNHINLTEKSRRMNYKVSWAVD